MQRFSGCARRPSRNGSDLPYNDDGKGRAQYCNEQAETETRGETEVPEGVVQSKDEQRDPSNQAGPEEQETRAS